MKHKTHLDFFFPFQELIDVDSEVVFELASYILQVSCFTYTQRQCGCWVPCLAF